MNPEIVLVLGCLGLGLLIAYVMWASVRTTILQLDLLKIVSDLDAAAKAGGTADEASYQLTRRLMLVIYFFAPYLSLSGFLNFWRRPSPRKQEQVSDHVSRLTAWGQTLPEEIRRAWLRVLIRIIIHFATSPIDSLFLIAMYASGRSERLASWFISPWQDLNRLGRYVATHPDAPPKAI